MLVFQANIHAMSSRVVLKDMSVGEVAWKNEQELIAKPYNDPTYMLVKVNSTWEIRPLHIRGDAKFFKWSNKRDKLLYWRNGDLFLTKLVKMGSDSLFSDKTTETELSWSPDDKYFAYVMNNNIWICTGDLKTKRRVTKKPVNETNYPQWTKSGKEIVFQGAYKNRYTMWKVDVKTGETKVINSKLGCLYYKWQMWNDKIVVIDETTFDLKQMSLTGKISNLTKDGKAGRSIIQYNQDGIYYTDNSRNLFKLANGVSKLILKEVDYASISPSGKLLAYAKDNQLYIAENFMNP
jgi:Tol biopolymer transport system component